MKSTYLQSLIATTAARITKTQNVIRLELQDAREYRNEGELAFAIDAYDCASRERSRLAKLVEMQRALKAELAANMRDVRIEAKIAKLVKVGFQYDRPKTLTTHEIEEALDLLVVAFVPKKADSRIAT